MKISVTANVSQMQKLMDDVKGRFSDKEIRDSLIPAAQIYRTSVMDEAPVLSGKLRKSVVVRKGRKGAVVFVAVDRKKALRTSAKFPKGFPYVNSVISEKRRGAKADKFVRRGEAAAEGAAGAQAVADLSKLASIRGIL